MAFVHATDTAQQPYGLDRKPSTTFGNRVAVLRSSWLSQIPQDTDIVRDRGENAEARMPWRKIYVGMLTQVAPHPHADREVVTEVEVGWSRLTIVTGGPHVEVGRKVAVALPGARVLDADSAVPRVRKLKKGRIRGVLSEGMLCSAKELGLSDDHNCIYVLSPEAPVGAPLAAWLNEDHVGWLA